MRSFKEALLHLKEERSGIDPGAQTYVLEEIIRRGESEEWWSSHWRQRTWQDDPAPPAATTAEQAASAAASPAVSPSRGSPWRGDGYVQLPLSPNRVKLVVQRR